MGASEKVSEESIAWISSVSSWVCVREEMGSTTFPGQNTNKCRHALTNKKHLLLAALPLPSVTYCS